MTHSNRFQEIELKIQGMTWMGWEPKVVSALEELPGVKKVFASFAEKKAVVSHDRSIVSVEKICQTLLKVGYVANHRTNDREILTHILNESEEKADTDPDMEDLICYCFEYTKGYIEQDYIKNGRSIILEKIVAEKKTGGCDCVNKNPKGRWCLGDVRQVVDSLKNQVRVEG